MLPNGSNKYLIISIEVIKLTHNLKLPVEYVIYRGGGVKLLRVLLEFTVVPWGHFQRSRSGYFLKYIDMAFEV